MFAKTTYAFNSGKVGKKVVFRYCAGKTLVGSFPIRRSPKAQPTAKQQAIRKKFQEPKFKLQSY